MHPQVDAPAGVVKYQVITRGEDEEIIVGRLKIPTVSILRSKKRARHASETSPLIVLFFSSLRMDMRSSYVASTRTPSQSPP